MKDSTSILIGLAMTAVVIIVTYVAMVAPVVTALSSIR